MANTEKNINMDYVTKYYDESIRYKRMAVDLLLDEIEKHARKTISENEDLKEFVMAMGTHFFTNSSDVDSFVCEEIEKILYDWNDELKLTGIPMKIKQNEERISDW